MVLEPGKEELARKIFDKWHLDFAVIGHLTDTQRMVLTFEGEQVADMPLDSLADDAPVYDRPHNPPTPQPMLPAANIPSDTSTLEALKTLMASPDIASKRWIWEQYDHMVMGDTIGRPGGDAAIVRVHGTDKALAITTDVTPRYCEADAFEGGKQAVAENWRNLTAVGATPLAITDCLNFGNPERPDIMGQFVAAIHGMGKACRALDFPVVSGNVSLYNETNGQAILPTPAVGSIGLIKDAAKRAHIAPEAGQELLLIGGGGTHLGASLYLREVLGREDGAPPTVDLERERKTGDFIRGLIEAGKLSTVHDISGGGLLVALTQMALAGKCGLDLTAASPTDTPHAFWFGEDQARYIIGTHDAQNMLSAAEAAGIAAMRLGQANASKQLKISDAETISMATLASAHESWLPSLMN